jgi:8-oxo-dGTP pyrophosphatase MutT (NUDIX family)
MEKWKQHIGVYGVYVKGNDLLVVKKTRGPYINRYDLPGGSFDTNESIQDCLVREMIEEVGYEFEPYKMIGTYDYLIPWEQENNHTHVHHIALYFEVRSNKEIQRINIVADDTEGFEFVGINHLSSENSSPLVQDIVKYLNNQEMNNELRRHDDWNILR